jgi:uncharacterized protein (TIGR00299 family) protein
VTVAWFHCFSGIAGDMALGALLDAGADRAAVMEMVSRLPGPSGGVGVTAVQRCGIAATRVEVAEETDHDHRPFAEVRRLVAAAGLPSRVCDRALAVFGRLAEVEGRIHGVAADDVEFHEVGSLDAVVDVVGVCAALEVLGVDDVRASAIALGTGTVRGAHGLLPNPAPAVVALLAEASAPAHGVDVGLELTTPTGAALVTTLATGFGPLPAMVVEAVGYGAGRRDLDGRPNVVQVVLGNGVGRGDAVGVPPGQPAVLLDVNVDDATGETVAHAIGALLDAGAHDAWVTPIVMKKGRPAYTVSALVDPSLVAAAAATLTAETGSLGVRAHSLERWPRARVDDTVTVDGFPVRVKVGAGRVKVENDDAVVAARGLGLPVREVAARADAAWRAAHGSPA